MKKALSVILSALMIISVVSSASLCAFADSTIPAPTGLKCTTFNSTTGCADFEWDEVAFPPLPSEVPLTAYDQTTGYTLYWSEDKVDWNNTEDRTNNFVWDIGPFTVGKTYYIKVRAWIRTTSRVNTIHYNYQYGEYSETLAFTPHNHTSGDEVRENVVYPTATAEGHYETAIYCRICGEEMSRTYTTLSAHEHKYDSGKITKTTAKTYTKECACVICGKPKVKTYDKKANTLKVTAKKPTVKYSKLKKKAQKIKAESALTVTKEKGTVTYTKKDGSKKITVDKNTGKITLKKGLKKGTYKVKIKVTASGTKTYLSKSKTVTVKIKVK